MKKKKPIVVAVSGGFDPVHVGHIRMLEDARKLGDYLVVILNNDNWLRDKKSFSFLKEEERAHILTSIKGVDEVHITEHKKGDENRSVSEALRIIKPDIFANGGDRRSARDIPEVKLCEELGIKMKFGVGGGKVQSSSWLTGRVATPTVQKPWGFMQTFRTEKNWWLKTITVLPGRRTSLQSHKKRDELWIVVEGSMYAEVGSKTFQAAHFQAIFVKKGEQHRISNKGKENLTLVEVSSGAVSENDIIRYEDDYGREARKQEDT